MLVPIGEAHAQRQVRSADLSKTQLFYEIHKAPTTRKRLATSLALRPTSVSQLIGELIADGLVVEGASIAHGSRKGRPEVTLGVVADRIIVPVIFFVSDRIRGALVDLAGNVLSSVETRLSPKEADSAAMLESVASTAETLLAAKPAHASIPSIGISVPGLVDSPATRWIYAARWPRMTGVDFAPLEQRLGIPIRIERNLNVEFRARLQRHPDERALGVLFVHWGYGIGSVYARDGRILESTRGGFGEFGHWTVRPNGRRCLCGQNGCLETEAALWALLPRLRKAHPGISAEEWELEVYLRTAEFWNMPANQEALSIFARALLNLYKIFFPEKIVLTGPFAQQPAVMARLDQAFRGQWLSYAGDVVLQAARPGVDDEVMGTAFPLLKAEMERLLLAHGSN